MDSRDETVRFLRTLFAAGDVFEIRALEAVTAEYQRPPGGFSLEINALGRPEGVPL